MQGERAARAHTRPRVPVPSRASSLAIVSLRRYACATALLSVATGAPVLCCWWADFVLPISAATGELLSFRSASADTLQPLPLALVVPVLRCLCYRAKQVPCPSPRPW